MGSMLDRALGVTPEPGAAEVPPVPVAEAASPRPAFRGRPNPLPGLSARPSPTPAGVDMPTAPAGGRMLDMALGMPTGTEMRSLDPAEPFSGQPIIDDPSRGASGFTIARASLAPNYEDQIRRFAEARGIPAERYGILNGEIVFHDPLTGELVKEVATFGMGPRFDEDPLGWVSRLGTQTAASMGPSLPQFASMGAGLAAAPAGPGASIGASAGAAGATDFARQLLDRGLAGEPLLENYDYLNTAGQTAAGGLGEALGLGAVRMFSRNPLGLNTFDRLAASQPEQMAEWAALRDEANRLGIGLSLGDLTGLPSLRVQERALRRYPEAADIFDDHIRARNLEEVPAAVRDELTRSLGPAKPIDEAVGRNPDFPPRDPTTGDVRPRPGMRGAAQDIIDAAATRRSRLSSPHYERGYASGVQVDVQPVRDLIEERMALYPEGHPAREALGAALRGLSTRRQVSAPNGGLVLQEAPLTDLRLLHGLKETWDSRLARMRTEGADPAALRRAEGELADAQRLLTRQMVEASPDDYGRGREIYIALSPEVERLRTGSVGRLADMNGLEAASMLDAAFSSARVTPPEVARLREAFFAAGRGDEYRAGLRSYIEDKLGRAMRELAGGDVPNSPGMFRAKLWNDPRDREVLVAALGGEQPAQGFTRLMDVLGAAARTKPEGSPTATDIAAMADMSERFGRGARVLGTLTSPQKLMQGGQLLADWWTRLASPGARRQLAEALVSPNGFATLQQLRMLSPTSEQAIRVTVDFLTRTGLLGGAGAVTRPGDRLPGTLPAPAP